MILVILCLIDLKRIIRPNFADPAFRVIILLSHFSHLFGEEVKWPESAF